MKVRFIFLAAALSFATPIPASAGDQSGYITFLLVHDNPNGTQKFDVRLDGTPSVDQCTVAGWSQDLTTPVGQAQYAMLLSAYLSGRFVRVSGNAPQTCYSERELIRNVYFSE